MKNIQEWRKNRYKLFNEKIDHFKNHSQYAWLRQYADDAIIWNEMSGYLMIKASDFIKRIEKMPISYIGEWLDGKNQLEWQSEFK